MSRPDKKDPGFARRARLIRQSMTDKPNYPSEHYFIGFAFGGIFGGIVALLIVFLEVPKIVLITLGLILYSVGSYIPQVLSNLR